MLNVTGIHSRMALCATRPGLRVCTRKTGTCTDVGPGGRRRTFHARAACSRALRLLEHRQLIPEAAVFSGDAVDALHRVPRGVCGDGGRRRHCVASVRCESRRSAVVVRPVVCRRDVSNRQRRFEMCLACRTRHGPRAFIPNAGPRALSRHSRRGGTRRLGLPAIYAESSLGIASRLLRARRRQLVCGAKLERSNDG